jgi:predicted nucleotidyltransferase
LRLRVYAHAVDGADRALAGALGDALDTTVASDSTVRESKGMDVLSRLGGDRKSIDTFCRRNGIRRLAVVGSALRDDFTADSDVDLLVEFAPDRSVSLFDMARDSADRRVPGVIRRAGGSDRVSVGDHRRHPSTVRQQSPSNWLRSVLTPTQLRVAP